MVHMRRIAQAQRKRGWLGALAPMVPNRGGRMGRVHRRGRPSQNRPRAWGPGGPGCLASCT
eukprot:1496870-Lingulodinium_polyedra.AAC.1